MEQHVANKSMLRKGCGKFFWLKDSVVFQHCLPQQQSSNVLDVERCKLLSPASTCGFQNLKKKHNTTQYIDCLEG
jgi:tRNA/tmRNA/rRNA uracil-C5-methylase (TrmA/RlmC/RlmD family)